MISISLERLQFKILKYLKTHFLKKEKTSVILGKCIYNHMPLKFHKQASTAILIALLVPVCRIYMLNKP